MPTPFYFFLFLSLYFYSVIHPASKAESGELPLPPLGAPNPNVPGPYCRFPVVALHATVGISQILAVRHLYRAADTPDRIRGRAPFVQTMT